MPKRDDIPQEALHALADFSETMPGETPVERARLLYVLAGAWLEANLNAAARHLAEKAESREP